MVNWPAIIKYPDDAELIYIRDQNEWADNADLHAADYDETDCLIDSSGNMFTLTRRKNNYVTPEPKGQALTLSDILGLVKAHAAQTGACCVAKLYAPTIIDAFIMVEALDEN